MAGPRVLIVGGGIDGLVAALSLLRRGIDVAVCERAAKLGEIGAGVQVSPNGTRALFALGRAEPLLARSCQASGKEIRLWSTGQPWTLFDPGAESDRHYGFPYLTVYDGGANGRAGHRRAPSITIFPAKSRAT